MTGEAAEVYTKSVQEAADESEIEVEKVVRKVFKRSQYYDIAF